jgi:AraC-like DNA-binding protein
MGDDLRSRAERACPDEGFAPTPIPALTFFRTVTPGDPRASGLTGPRLTEPAICVVVAGRKTASVGARRIDYAPGTYTLISVDLPMGDMVVREAPFIGLHLALDPAVLADLLVDLPPEPVGHPAGWTISASPLTADLVDSLDRLVRTLDDPYDVAALAPAIRREIAYRLLRGPHRPLLRQIAGPDSRLAQIKRAIDRIRADIAAPLRVPDLAALVAMSPSSFHQHFKAVTAMSPLQYQKRLRLHEARRLILDGAADATTASYAVGYDSPSQFSRDYKRAFGAPPIRDTRRLVQEMAAGTGEQGR